MPNTFARTNSNYEEWKIVDKFDSAYWSGLDVQVYANQIFLNEAIQVSYLISEQIRPYYSYSSYVADRIYHGARIIQGEISMNFKRDGYLFALINLIRRNPDGVTLKGRTVIQDSTRESETLPIDYRNDAYGEDLWQQIKTTGLPQKVASSIKDKYRISTEMRVNEIDPVVKQSKGAFETTIEGFDLNIIFGANLSAAQSLKFYDGGQYDLDPMSNQAQMGIVENEPGIIASTGIKIVGVSIAGLSRTVNDDGRPLIETYSFQARDVVILRNVDAFKPSPDKVMQSPVKRNDNSGNRHGKIGSNELPHNYDS